MADYHGAPLPDLPPELLERIFQLHAEACREPEASARDKGARRSSCSAARPYSWIWATHVCRYWRNAALGSSLLWSHIVLTRNMDCIKAFLERSQPAPLTVIQPSFKSSCFGEGFMPVAPVRLVLAEMDRIRCLELYIKWWLFDDIASLLSQPAANLKSLTLSTPHGLYDSGVIQPVIHLDDSKPSLESLSLRAFGFPWWNAAPYSTLKSLHIDKGIPEKPSVLQVVRALQLMPNLVNISLDGIFTTSPKHLTSIPVVDEVAILRRLRYIQLRGDIISCMSLLNSLIFPGSVHIFLDFYITSRNADLPLAALPICRKLTGPHPHGVCGIAPAPGPPVRVDIDRGQSSFLLKCYPSSSTSQSDHTHSPFIPSVSVRVSLQPGCLEAICRDLPTECLKMVVISDWFDWTEVEPYLSCAEELHLNGWTVNKITHLLQHGCNATVHNVRDTDTDDAGSCAAAFPALRSLAIRNLLESGPPCPRDAADHKREIIEAVNARNRCSSAKTLEEVGFEL